MRKFLTALQFLTIIPAGAKQIEGKDLAPAMIYFPLVGLSIGLISVPAIMFGAALGLSEIALSCIIVVAIIVITGGLHLDGLADTFDAIASGKPKDEMLKIMRDPHIGTMGVLALVSTLLLKVALLYNMTSDVKITAIILMCVLSRWSMVIVAANFPYARNEGKAKMFIDGVNSRIVGIATLIACVIAIIMAQFQGVMIAAIVGLAAYLTAKMIARKIGGMTGDTLGAVSELMEVFTLFLMCMINRGAA